jgi:hypothetical protein
VAVLTTSEWIDAGVAAGTGALALATAWMAWFVRRQAEETRKLAETAEGQLGELRRSAAAAEATAVQGERTLAATSLPVLRIVRTEQDAAAVTVDGHAWSVVIVNIGPVSATITESRLELCGQQIPLEAAPTGPIAPRRQCVLRSDVPPRRSPRCLAGRWK